ncbi:hypothetical protein C8J57DRAFT_732987 [Mycena rebaudengoi]|nr:hypothetical protein C8J57DRAFT_732987 [Mycena rebaudengoi]
MGKSPFVIFRPQGGARTTTDSHVPIRATDLPAIDSSFPNGGSVLSVHAPLQADAWLDAHCGDSVVRALNASGLRGPLPAMLDPTLSALVLFGATGDRAHHKHAKRLADISGLTVLLRALEDFPVFGADLDLESSDDVSASGGETAKETTAEQRQDMGGSPSSGCCQGKFSVPVTRRKFKVFHRYKFNFWI